LFQKTRQTLDKTCQKPAKNDSRISFADLNARQTLNAVDDNPCYIVLLAGNEEAASRRYLSDDGSTPLKSARVSPEMDVSVWPWVRFFM